MKNKHI